MATEEHRVIATAILLCGMLVPSEASFASQTFRVQTDFNGNAVCSVDAPTYSMTMGFSDMALQCGVQCTTSDCCYYYQFNSYTTQCDLYNYVPQNFRVIDRCTGYGDSNGVCPVGWSRQCTNCYKAFTATMNWQAAALSCQTMFPSAHLVTIADSVKQKAVGTVFNGTTPVCKVGGTWIGGQIMNYTQTGNAVWAWPAVTGRVDAVPFTYTNWASTFPTATGGNCTYMVTGATWKNAACSSSKCYICQLK